MTWRAPSDPVTRGVGDSVPRHDFGAFLGGFADAGYRGTATGPKARDPGPWTLDPGDFLAELGKERDGSLA